MIFKIEPVKDKFIERNYNKSMKELSAFYELNWKHNKPVIILLGNRKEIDSLYGMETENWVVAFAQRGKIFILNRKNYEKESNHKYSNEEYSALIKHELSHSFFEMKTRRAKYKPAWLNEGMAIFISGQNKLKRRPEKFENILDFYEVKQDERNQIYKEAGFIIELLFNKFGKEKLMKLIDEVEKVNNKNDFEKLFKKIYGFELSYKKLNELWKE